MFWPFRCRPVRPGPALERKLDKLFDALNTLAREIKTMSAQSDALNKKVDDLSTAVTNIAADIAEIKAGLPAEGGMTADEVAALDARLGTVVAAAQALDAENPAPTVG